MSSLFRNKNSVTEHLPLLMIIFFPKATGGPFKFVCCFQKCIYCNYIELFMKSTASHL